MKIVAVGRWWNAVGAHLKYAVAFGERQMLKDPHTAQDDVAAQVRSAIADGAEAVCLPGSSVPTLTVDEVPPKVLKASRGGVVVIETFVEMQRAEKVAGPGTRRAWVLRDGEVLRGPIEQIFSSSWQVKTRAGRVANLLALAKQIERGVTSGDAPDTHGRIFSLTDGRVGLLLLCGEFNAVYGGKPDGMPASFAAGATAEHVELDRLWRHLPTSGVVVFNPTHTWTTLPAVIGKREFLSSRGAYVAPTNAYEGFGAKRTQHQAGVVQLRRRPPALMRTPLGAGHGAFITHSIDVPAP